MQYGDSHHYCRYDKNGIAQEQRLGHTRHIMNTEDNRQNNPNHPNHNQKPPKDYPTAHWCYVGKLPLGDDEYMAALGAGFLFAYL